MGGKWLHQHSCEKNWAQKKHQDMSAKKQKGGVKMWIWRSRHFNQNMSQKKHKPRDSKKYNKTLTRRNKNVESQKTTSVPYMCDKPHEVGNKAWIGGIQPVRFQLMRNTLYEYWWIRLWGSSASKSEKTFRPEALGKNSFNIPANAGPPQKKLFSDSTANHQLHPLHQQTKTGGNNIRIFTWSNPPIRPVLMLLPVVWKS